MNFEKVNYIEYQTLITAKNMNDIQDAIIELLKYAIDKRKITLGMHTDGLLYVFIDGAPVGSGIAMGSGASGDIIGNLDSENNIILTGNLADGIYTLKYENEDGTYTEIGALEVGTKEDKPVTSTYTNLADPTSEEWMDGHRISSSGVIEATEGVTLMNTIQCVKNDTIRVKGVTTVVVAMFDENGTIMGRSTIKPDNTNFSSIVVEGDYNQFTIAYSACKSIRFYGTLSGTAEDVIITVNEKIE